MSSGRGAALRTPIGWAEIAATVALVVLHRHLWIALRLRETLLVYAPGSAEQLSDGELRLFAIQLLGLPAAFLAGDGLSRITSGRSLLALAAARAKTSTAVLAVLSTLASMAIAVFVLRFAELTDDERTYLFEARALLDGHLVSSAPSPMAAFPHHFVVAVGEGKWAGIFPVGQPLLLALGLVLGQAHLINWLCCGFAVWMVGRFAEEQWDGRTAIIAASLMATSPIWIFVSATLHNIVPTVACAVTCIWATARVVRGARPVMGLLIGSTVGYAFLTRPLDALLLGACSVGVLLARERPARVLTTVGLVVAAGAPFLFVQLSTYHAISGSYLVSPYSVWLGRDWPKAHLFGFGPTVWNYEHTSAIAVAKSVAVFVRMNLWALGWPLSLLGLGGWLAGLGRDRATNSLFVLLAVHAVAYFFYAFAAVHDFGSYYHLLGLPALALITARAVLAARERLEARAPGRGRLFLATVAAGSLFGMATFVPAQISRLRYVAEIIRRPLVLAGEAAARGPILVFHDSFHPPPGLTSWVYFAPLPSPRLDDPVLWCRTRSDELAHAVARRYPERALYQLRWEAGRPVLIALQPR